MFHSIIARRLFKTAARSPLLYSSQRTFSVLLAPLESKPELPSEVQTMDMTEAELDEVHAGYKEFNRQCAEELKEMNQNLISNIIEGGGIEGWETVSITLIV
jgi:hypothetical protein